MEEEDEDQKQIDQVIEKWSSLQKIIKEGITLNQISKYFLLYIIVENQQEDNKNTLNTKFIDYYKNKLIVREIFEKTSHIDNNSYNFKPFELIVKERETILSNSFIPAEKLFSLLRNDFSFIVKIASVMELRLEDPHINSIVDLFCHQFYENILIPNPEHEELLILCSLLLEQEIKHMTTLSISSFIDENSTFLGKFLKSYTKKPELKTYLSMTLGKIIALVENNGEFFMDLNPIKILSKEIAPNGSYNNIDQKRKLIESLYSKANHKGSSSSNLLQPNMNNFANYEKDIEGLDFIIPIVTRQRINSIAAEKINEFTNKITQANLIQRIINEKDENIKEFYKRQIERLSKDKNIYTCDQFLESLYHLKTKDSILKHYVNNFEVIKILIETIIKSLISSVTTIPYSLRCICKIICILIQKRFPHISTYERNAFIGEFIFGKCILPILVDCDHNGVITSSILSSNIRECLKIASKVLIKISRGLLFDSTIDMNYTIFNQYIIEIIPEINRFCNELIKVKLPCVVDDLVSDKLKDPMTKYDYFNVNKDEIINMQCVCFSIEDILTLVEHIEPVINSFKPKIMEKSNEFLFYKTFEKLISQKADLRKVIYQSKKRQFFLIFPKEENPNKNTLVTVSQEKFYFCTSDDTTNLIRSKIKYCIEIILQELNLLNNKVYSYLNQAKTNEKFFLGINQTLQIEEYNIEMESNKIPLNWYSLYLISNLQKLDNKYKKNDFEALYEELTKEEKSMIQLLKEKSNVIITKYGKNLRCAETLLQKARVDQSRAEKIIKIIKTKKMIESKGIDVCVTSFNEIDSPMRANTQYNLRASKRGSTKPGKILMPKCLAGDFNPSSVNIFVCPIEGCIHDDCNDQQSNKTSKYKSHTKNIKEFIRKFGDFHEVCEDILQGKQTNNIAKTLTNFLLIVQQKMENEPMFKYENELANLNALFIKATNDTKNIDSKEEAEKWRKEITELNEKKKNEIIEIIEKIRYFIFKRIYLKVYPEKPSNKDILFYQKTLMLSWITPDHLDIKKIFINEKLWELAIASISKMDEGRTPQQKVMCIENAYSIINRSIKFSSGKKDDSGAEELTPIFQFIVIKAQSKRLFSNINYIKGLCDPENEEDPYKGKREFFLGQVEAAATFITDLTYNQLKITKEDFDKNIEEKMNENKLSCNKAENSSYEMSSSYNSNNK